MEALTSPSEYVRYRHKITIDITTGLIAISPLLKLTKNISILKLWSKRWVLMSHWCVAVDGRDIAFVNNDNGIEVNNLFR